MPSTPEGRPGTDLDGVVPDGAADGVVADSVADDVVGGGVVPDGALRALAESTAPYLIGVRHHSPALSAVMDELLDAARRTATSSGEKSANG